jgi:hypothetical protein
MEPYGDRQVHLHIAGAANGRSRQLTVDFLLDCTGMNPQLLDSPLLADLVNSGSAALNALGGLDVGPHFEVRGINSGPSTGCLYASGAIARGGYLAPSDSFLGFTYAAIIICDDLAAHGACRRLGTKGSVTGWIKWLGRRAP